MKKLLLTLYLLTHTTTYCAEAEKISMSIYEADQLLIQAVHTTPFDEEKATKAIAYGANINIRNGGFCSFLDMMIKERSPAALEFFLKHGARTSNNSLPYALERGDYEKVKLLAQHGVNVNALASWGEIPINLAVKQQDPRILQLLLRYGAQVDTINNSGLSPVDAACIAGKIDTVKLLLEHQGQINSKHMRFAIKHGHLALVEYLLKEQSIDPNSKNSQNFTMLDTAILYNRDAIAKCLIQHGAIQKPILPVQPTTTIPPLLQEHRARTVIASLKEQNKEKEFKSKPLNTAPSTLLSQSGNATTNIQHSMQPTSFPKDTSVTAAIINKIYRTQKNDPQSLVTLPQENPIKTHNTTTSILATEEPQTDRKLPPSLVSRSIRPITTPLLRKSTLPISDITPVADKPLLDDQLSRLLNSVQLTYPQIIDIQPPVTLSKEDNAITNAQNTIQFSAAPKYIFGKSAPTSTVKAEPISPAIIDSQPPIIEPKEDSIPTNIKEPEKSYSSAHDMLMHGIITGNLELVETAFANGAQANAKDAQGYTAMARAAENKKYDIIQILLLHEADIHSIHPSGWSILDIALANDDTRTARLLRKNGAEPKVTDPAQIIHLDKEIKKIASYKAAGHRKKR